MLLLLLLQNEGGKLIYFGNRILVYGCKYVCNMLCMIKSRRRVTFSPPPKTVGISELLP